MSTDTLDSGGMDCGRRVMPCPSCASICHQVMRLCPYLTPDRVQYDLFGDAVAHVSQYGGHPAFYCPLENWHASDPAYGDSCESGYVDEYNDPDYLHNLCVDPSLSLSKRSVEFVKEYKTCCWTYTYSLLSYNRAFEEDATNRVVLNCCDVSGNCEKSDAGTSNVSSSLITGSYMNRRTANNQVRTQDGRFRELNSYQADDGEDSYEEYASGRELQEYDADNKRVVRETHNEFWIETKLYSNSHQNCLICDTSTPLNENE
ncbi:unnamed protein product [Orchesella dallaii]|uniref:Uncharacterized protein n=1 Tax=Orchesella dallaii TaxID=48710 RepID=A0ABP1QXG4_9HEXA